ncbi:MAG: OadG family protein [Chloroflexi bacterium]|nr:OadG family protein [Chloroflexota bacterium]
MEIGRGLIITGIGMAVVYVALTAMWLAMAALSRLPARPLAEKSATKTSEVGPQPAQAREEDVAALAAALLQAQQGGSAPSPPRRPLSPWRAVVRMVGAPFWDRDA